MLKIVQVSPFYYPDPGGISYHVQSISKHLDVHGDKIYVVRPRNILELGHKQSANLDRITYIPSIYLPAWPYPTLKSLSFPLDFGTNLKQIIKEVNPDIVHIHGHHYPISWLALTMSKKFGVPAILTLHGMFALNPKAHEGKTTLEVIFNELFFKSLLKRTTSVIGLTDRITTYAHNYGKSHIIYQTIPNGIEVYQFESNIRKKQEYRQKYGIKENSLVVLFRGRFEEVKGIIEFARAARDIIEMRLEKVEFLLVGDGTQSSRVRYILKDLNGIHIFSWQPSESIHELYIASDIYVIPSKFEALPITVIEAMNSSLHIIHTPVGGIPEILQNYRNKTAIGQGSVDEIRDAIVFLLRNHQFLDADTDSLIYARTFDWTKITSQIRNLYLRSVERNKL